jgi:hypothetical protein
MASNIGNAYMNSAANTGNAAMAAAGQRTSAFGGAANVLGRMYGPQGQGTPWWWSNRGGGYIIQKIKTILIRNFLPIRVLKSWLNLILDC